MAAPALSSLIQRAFLHHDNQEREQAEALIQAAMTQNQEGFLLECAIMINQENGMAVVRSGAATLIKNLASK